jgi:hypothetical protein
MADNNNKTRISWSSLSHLISRVIRDPHQS